MRRQTLILTAMACILIAAGMGKAQENYILETSPASVDTVASKYSLTVETPVDDLHPGIVLVSAPTGTIQSIVANDPSVEKFELDQAVNAPESITGLNLNQSSAPMLSALGNVTLTTFYGVQAWTGYVNQPAGQLINLSSAQSDYGTGSGIVAVIDDGVDPNQPVLKSVLVPGYDFTRNTAGIPSELADLSQATSAILEGNQTTILQQNTLVPLSASTIMNLDQATSAILEGQGVLPSDFGHGTMVAGLIHLVAPTAQIMPLKAFDSNGNGDLFNILRAIYFATENGAKVINMSFSMPAPSPLLAEAVETANENGVICVAAAGNSGQETMAYPAAVKGVLGVASTNNSDQQSTFTNYGSYLVEITAPGEGVITTYPGGYYAAGWGTSFSAAWVSGAAAIIYQMNNQTNQGDVTRWLSYAKYVSTQLGFGRIDLNQALSKLSDSMDN